MAIYWAIGLSKIYSDICVKRIEADSDQDAAKQAKEWHGEDLDFQYQYVLTKEIPKG